jgi:hypothetical protein
MRLTDDELHALKDRNPVTKWAGGWVKLRAKRKGEFVGPCPICPNDPQSKTASRFECTADKWVCAVCQDGGDVIALVMRHDGIDFSAAIDKLGGAVAEVITPKIAERRGLQAYARAEAPGAEPAAYPDSYDDALRRAYAAGWRKAASRAAYEHMARMRERGRLFDFWLAGTAIEGAPAGAYLAARGLIVPDNARLKFHPSMPLFCDGREDGPIMAHRGPAMLAAIYHGPRQFRGLHITWLDPAGPKGKAHVLHPETGAALPSKKVRGSKAGGYIDLGGAVDGALMIAGEGIETVLAVYTALVRAGRDVSRTVLRSSVDLGNLGGRAIETVPHPDLKGPGGRAQRVPGGDPDLTSPAMPVPAGITDLILLGDGDSDPLLTGLAIARAERRHQGARPDLRVRQRFAAPGLDFNDMLSAGHRT